MWDKIKELADKHGYMSGVDRQSDRVKETGEVFTPTDLVIELCQKLMEADPKAFAPTKSILDPACGDGQFLVVARYIKTVHHGMGLTSSLNDIYGVDIMRDNVDLCKKRLGGGNIIMGDTLNPNLRLEGQTDEEHRLMKDWFSEESDLEDFL